jgi:hypothetical protein
VQTKPSCGPASEEGRGDFGRSRDTRTVYKQELPLFPRVTATTIHREAGARCLQRASELDPEPSSKNIQTKIRVRKKCMEIPLGKYAEINSFI